MPLYRTVYKDNLFGRKKESDSEGKEKSHKKEIPIASITMELLGETEPVAVSDNSALLQDTAYIYEYTWDIGLTGRNGVDWLDKLDPDDTLLVQILVQKNQHYSVREKFATLEYLPPTRYLSDTPKILKRTFSSIKDAMMNVDLKQGAALSGFVSDIIPSHDEQGVRWYLNRFDLTDADDDGKMLSGIEWHISSKLLKEVGTRLIGRLGVIFIDAPIQGKILDGVSEPLILFTKLGLKLPKDGKNWYDFSMLPNKNSSELQLKILPKKA